jgi:lipoprotein-anchoring transpeptidase ErfK/SrfK
MAKHFGGILMHNIYLSVFVGLLLIITSTAWGDEAATKKEIQVFIEKQVLVALENGEEVYNFDVVTGSDGKETTAGRYRIFRKHKKYTSKTYGSEMPYTMFFTKDGKAIHGTQMATLRSYLHSYLTESVGSKGCIGLTDDNAKALFDWAPVGTLVVVISEEE